MTQFTREDGDGAGDAAERPPATREDPGQRPVPDDRSAWIHRRHRITGWSLVVVGLFPLFFGLAREFALVYHLTSGPMHVYLGPPDYGEILRRVAVYAAITVAIVVVALQVRAGRYGSPSGMAAIAFAVAADRIVAVAMSYKWYGPTIAYCYPCGSYLDLHGAIVVRWIWWAVVAAATVAVGTTALATVPRWTQDVREKRDRGERRGRKR